MLSWFPQRRCFPCLPQKLLFQWLVHSTDGCGGKFKSWAFDPDYPRVLSVLAPVVLIWVPWGSRRAVALRFSLDCSHNLHKVHYIGIQRARLEDSTVPGAVQTITTNSSAPESLQAKLKEGPWCPFSRWDEGRLSDFCVFENLTQRVHLYHGDRVLSAKEINPYHPFPLCEHQPRNEAVRMPKLLLSSTHGVRLSLKAFPPPPFWIDTLRVGGGR